MVKLRNIGSLKGLGMNMRIVLFLLLLAGVFMKVRNLDLQRTVFVVFRIMKEMNGRR